KITGEQHELVTEFVWDGSHLVQEIDHKTDRTYNYIYSHLNSYKPLAQVYNEGDKQVVNYFHCDQIGIPREMTDSQGNIIWKGNYYAWGQLKPSRENHTAHQPFRLQNQYFDKETGLHYNFFRFYDPILGRFVNQDPIGLDGGENLYLFARNTQHWVDPLGLATYMCTRRLGQPSGTSAPPIFNHTYLCTGNNSANMYCSSTTQKIFGKPEDSWKPTDSRPTTMKEDSFSINHCDKVSKDQCVEECVTNKLKNPKTRTLSQILCKHLFPLKGDRLCGHQIQ
ncbi:RHS repeat domain-containing protein, partial [Actinobacillus vicugnae]|uniref:RHS repeat domain-containing protein n=1 Tax=Actinobacillus vicugnae TaxID=2573093 RepID=UPI001AD78A73